MFAITTIAMLAFLPGTPPPDAPAISLKFYDGEQGDIREVTKNGEEKTTVSSKGQAGKTAASGVRYSYKEEIIEKDKKEKLPTKLKRIYSKARVVKEGKEITLPYEGKEVLIEKKGNTYEFSIDGKALDKKDAERLDKEWNKTPSGVQNGDIVPKKPVAVNETWQIDAESVIKDLAKSGIEGDPKNSKASVKLVKTYSKGTQLYGVIEVDIDVAVKSIKQGGMEIAAKDGSKYGVHMEIETAIDGSKSEDTVKGTIKSEIKFETRGTEITVTGQVQGKDVSKPVKK